MWDPYDEVQSQTMPNGLTVYASHWPGRPWEAMGFIIHSGAKQDPVGLEGVAHFVEHLISDNTDVLKKDINAFFNDCGGGCKLGTTGHTYTHYSFFVPVDKAILVRAFSIFGQMLLLAKLEKCIERERQVITGEFHRKFPLQFKIDTDMRKHKALYTGYWLERFLTPMGFPESIGLISPEELQSYYDGHYTPANISIVGVGGMTLTELIELILASPFGTDKKGVRTSLPISVTDITPPLEIHHVLDVSKYLKMAAPLEIGGYNSVAKIPGNFNPQVISIFQRMIDEVLNEEVREKRALTYDIGSARHFYGHFYEFSINCSAFAIKAINEIEEIIETCIASMGESENLFVQCKARAISANSMVDLMARNLRDEVVDDLCFRQRIITTKEIITNLEKVKMSDIHNLLQRLLPEWRWTLITRP